jgi:hypothetical protein
MSSTSPVPDDQASARTARPAGTSGVRDQIHRMRHDGGTYRAIAAAGLAPSTVHSLATGRLNPTAATELALRKATSKTLPRARVDAADCGSAPCTSWATARPASPAPWACAR